jgi:hypothetical protein
MTCATSTVSARIIFSLLVANLMAAWMSRAMLACMTRLASFDDWHERVEEHVAIEAADVRIFGRAPAFA